LDLVKAQEGAREFFIPSILEMILAQIFSARMKIETGENIYIGFNPFHGAMYELAKKMNYDMKGMFWGSGDIDKFDKSIIDRFLSLYVLSCKRYYNYEKFPEIKRMVFERLLKDLAYHLSNKVVLHLDNLWRFMRGVMPSGDLFTSHGDSWILALFWWLYIESVKDRHPNLARIIDKYCDLGFILIVVYGDDHIWCCPIKLRGVINVAGWTEFLKNCCRAILRDGKEYDRFLSIPNELTGDLKYVGPKFLKRHFIANTNPRRGEPPVLPYKRITEAALHLFCSTNQLPLDYVLSGIGHLWDTTATNAVHFNLINNFLDRICKANEIKDYREHVKEMMNDLEGRKRIQKFVRKFQINVDTLFDCIPTWEKIRERHQYDPVKCRFGINLLKFKDWELVDLESPGFEEQDIYF